MNYFDNKKLGQYLAGEAMDEAPRKHADGTPCKAQSPESCPFNKKVEQGEKEITETGSKSTDNLMGASIEKGFGELCPLEEKLYHSVRDRLDNEMFDSIEDKGIDMDGDVVFTIPQDITEGEETEPLYEYLKNRLEKHINRVWAPYGLSIKAQEDYEEFLEDREMFDNNCIHGDVYISNPKAFKKWVEQTRHEVEEHEKKFE